MIVSYRGYEWSVWPTVATTHRTLRAHASRRDRIGPYVVFATAYTANDILDAARSRYARAHRSRRTMPSAVEFLSVDRVPWEIHEIACEDLYQEALTAFKTARQLRAAR